MIIYQGDLYGQVAGEFVKLEHNTNYYDELEAENKKLKEQLQRLICCTNCNNNELHYKYFCRCKNESICKNNGRQYWSPLEVKK